MKKAQHTNPQIHFNKNKRQRFYFDNSQKENQENNQIIKE